MLWTGLQLTLFVLFEYVFSADSDSVCEVMMITTAGKNTSTHTSVSFPEIKSKNTLYIMHSTYFDRNTSQHPTNRCPKKKTCVWTWTNADCADKEIQFSNRPTLVKNKYTQMYLKYIYIFICLIKKLCNCSILNCYT